MPFQARTSAANVVVPTRTLGPIATSASSTLSGLRGVRSGCPSASISIGPGNFSSRIWNRLNRAEPPWPTHRQLAQLPLRFDLGQSFSGSSVPPDRSGS